ncbi:SdiA-regulated domain-containing protein [Carboxylicivirga sediminis]|uniref:SdiA-regulated domain-containing protein n=1 Tax=Carboxylicivirga sediminis TaxID=2006564 RepID=A0A941F702_9BACT|nr:SdiA-regulated domain-containing protein [Carboxylicivirga sediminis]MBR8537742.1 SdiA-regulated domain-containing protein [Carboxylicivirga sediminis]
MRCISFKLLSIVLLLASCTSTGSQVWKVKDGVSTTYNFPLADTFLELDNSLQEVSGLEYDVKSQRLLAINDEKGIIYEIDRQSGKADELYEFHKSGDYEGLARAGKFIFVLKSNGKLYRYNTDKDKTKVYDTGLSAINDAEGLYYEQSFNSLLIACKGLPLSENRHEKAIYRFRLDTKQLDADPVLLINVEQLKQNAENELNAEQLWRLNRFAPSGVAIHPESGQIFLLSARGSMLMVFDAKHSLDYVVFLDMQKLPQPEGIAFDEELNLYIASEGKAGRGKLMKFTPN